jgi:putative acetyltransferase
VNEAAFGGPEEADLVDLLRVQASPLISLGAEHDGEVVGHIMFTPVTIAGHPELGLMGLAPMAVAPAQQREGIGSALVRQGLERCKRLGTDAVVVLGHADYYPRFGFQPASKFGLSSAYDAPDEAFMALELRHGCLEPVSGIVRFHAAFVTN